VEPEVDPPMPTGLVAESGDEEVRLSWDPPVGGVTFDRFRVYRGASPDQLSYVGATLPNQPSFVVGALTNGITYHFAVSASITPAAPILGGADREGPRSATVSAVPQPRFRVEGLHVGLQEQSLRVSRRTEGVEGAVVEVNGVVLAEAGAGDYEGVLPVPLEAGDELVVSVRVGEASIEGSARVPVAATILAPLDGTEFASTQAFQVSWETPEDPDRFEVLLCWVGCSESRRHLVSDGSVRSVQLSPLGLPVDRVSEYTVRVVSLRDGTFTGSVEDGSRLGVRAEPVESSVPGIRVHP